MNLEDDIRRVLTDDRVALPGWPDPVARVRDGIRRRRRHRAATVAVTAAVAAVAIGTSAVIHLAAAPGVPPAQPTGRPSVIPFVAIPTPAQTPPTQSPLPPAAACRSGQLTPPSVVTSEGAGGHHFQTIEVRNTGPRCTLAGSPTLVAVDKVTGGRGTIPTRSASYDLGGGAQSPATIDTGQGARVLVVTAMGCAGGANPTILVNVALGYAGTEHAVPGLTLESTCPIEMGDWYWQPPVPSQPPAASQPPPRFSAVDVALTDVPASARAGSQVAFVVVLTNQADLPISLIPCPSYTIEFGKFSHASGLLNCLVDQIPAHRSVRFAMRLAISTNTTDSPDRLYWRLVDGDGGPEATAPLRLE